MNQVNQLHGAMKASCSLLTVRGEGVLWLQNRVLDCVGTHKKFPLSCYKWNIQKMIVYNDCNKRQKREKIKNQQNEKNVYVVLGRENGGANEITTKKWNLL